MAPALAAPAPRVALEGLIQESRRLLKGEYGSRLAGLVFHGSAARETAHQESDIDLLVLLEGEFDYWRELRRITAVLYPLEIESGHLLSAFPVGPTSSRAASWRSTAPPPARACGAATATNESRPRPRSRHLMEMNADLMGARLLRSGVDLISWRSHPLGEGSPRCRGRDGRNRRSLWGG